MLFIQGKATIADYIGIHSLIRTNTHFVQPNEYFVQTTTPNERQIKEKE